MSSFCLAASGSVTNCLIPFTKVLGLGSGLGGSVPAHLRDAHYAGARGLGHGSGYRYPHDDPRGVVTQRYAPEGLVHREYYQPAGHGAERAVAERLPRLRRIVRGAPEDGGTPG